MKHALLLAFCLFTIQQTAFAQLEKILHQAFELEGINNVSINLYGEYEIEKWAGNAILIESHIQLYDASPNILKHVLNEGRYMITAKKDGETLQIQSKDLVRKTIHKNSKQCYEFVKVRLLIPEDFTVASLQNLQRDLKLETSAGSVMEQ